MSENKITVVQNDELDIFKISYIGNKRRFAEKIVSKFPKEAKKVFDPACGCSSVLIEAARQGYEVMGNDVSIYPYWFSKGVFEGVVLNDQDKDKLLSYKKRSGWLTNDWQGKHPRTKDFRNTLDGIVLQLKEFQGPKLWTARAAVCRFMGSMFGDVPSWLNVGYARGRTPDLDKTLKNSVNEVNGYIQEVAGKGKITNNDSNKMDIPSADIIYFDPPYYTRGRAPIKYFAWYKLFNSLLIQKKWEPAAEELSIEALKSLLEKLSKRSQYLFVSSSRNSVIPWASELKKYKKKVSVTRFEYAQPSNVTNRKPTQKENLISGKSVSVEQNDPYMEYLPEDEIYRYVVHEHWRGASMHNDFRYESKKGESLLGWTINSLIKESVENPTTTLEQTKELKYDDYSKINWDTGEFTKRRIEGSDNLVNIELVCEKKEPEPFSWIDFEGVVPIGTVGATKQFPGVFRIVDHGIVEVGALKPWLAEYFPSSDKDNGGLNYRIFFRQMRVLDITGKKEKYVKSITSNEEAFYTAIKEASCKVDVSPDDKDWDIKVIELIKQMNLLAITDTELIQEAAWFLIKPIDKTPYVLSVRAVKDIWIPQQGISALPKSIRETVPEEYRYWLLDREQDRCALRDLLVEAITKGTVKIEVQ